ncbi:amt-3 [Cordylochernes scorpioides]|uniref:Amt-3 n=1 Tax=Cordylochernes scorpioides TaxID=51811 RepID=A0ABY6LMN4_9ARAC|nr:amt-3 [Cordylochernes scorpioides]
MNAIKYLSLEFFMIFNIEISGLIIILVVVYVTGFAMLESGFVTRKNEVNIMMKNVADVLFGGFAYWLFGFGLSFGSDAGTTGFAGIGHFLVDSDILEDEDGNAGALFSKYLFQLSFATTATTIVSGAIAERCHFPAYCVFSFFNTLVYCIPAGWVWSDTGFLRRLQVVDLAGCSAVHLVGGCSALAGALVLGPRLNRPTPMGNPVNALLGLFLLCTKYQFLPMFVLQGASYNSFIPFFVLILNTRGTGHDNHVVKVSRYYFSHNSVKSLVTFIERNPGVSFAQTDALGLGREEVLDLLSSKTKAHKRGRHLTPPQSNALAGLINQILDLRPGGSSNIYKVLRQVISELRTGPAAVTSNKTKLTPAMITPPPPAPTEMEEDVPMTEEERCAPPLPAPRRAEPTPPTSQGQKTTPAMATPPPPPSVRMEDDSEPDCWTDLVDLIDELIHGPGLEPILRAFDADEFVDVVRDPEMWECVVAELSGQQKKMVAQFLDGLIERTRDSAPLIQGIQQWDLPSTSSSLESLAPWISSCETFRSTLYMSSLDYTALSAVVTINSSIAGGLMSVMFSYIFHRKLLISDVISGILGALVSITVHVVQAMIIMVGRSRRLLLPFTHVDFWAVQTFNGVNNVSRCAARFIKFHNLVSEKGSRAGCAVYRPWEGLVVGGVGGLLATGAAPCLEKAGLDDPVGAVAVHAVAAVWGMLAVALLVETNPALTFGQKGLFRGGGWTFLGRQALAIVAVGCWAALTTGLLLFLVNLVIPIRMKEENEKLGADLTEHGIQKSLGPRCNYHGALALDPIPTAAANLETTPNHNHTRTSFIHF